MSDLALLLVLLAVLQVLLLGGTLTLAFLLRRRSDAAGTIVARLDGLERLQERTERGVRDDLARGRDEAAQSARALRGEVAGALDRLTQANEQRLEALRGVVDARLRLLLEDNARRLEEMRRTVDEKLQATLEERLDASFRLVSERLEQVHRGLGEMQALAAGVGDLKRVLANVKTRGTWGEVQLGTLLEQVLAPDQYAANVATHAGSSERVEFAVRLPGPDGDVNRPVWLPIDAKFPLEDYQRLVEAIERADPVAAEQAGRDLEARVRASAREIRDKYLNPPATTDFAILFLPTEGLYAEVLRRAGLADGLQRDCRVLLAGPTTLWAVLSSLRVGFRTLAIERRSSEVWTLLGKVKAEFGAFGGVLDAVQRKLTDASGKIDEVKRKGRRIERELREVQELPAPDPAPSVSAPRDTLFAGDDLPMVPVGRPEPARTDS